MAAFVVTNGMVDWLRLEGGPVDATGNPRTPSPASLLPSDAEAVVKEICRRRTTDQAALFQAVQSHCEAVSSMAEMAAVCGTEALVKPFHYEPINEAELHLDQMVVVVFMGVVYGPGCLIAHENGCGLVKFSETESEWFNLFNIRRGNQLREVNMDLAASQSRLGLKCKFVEGSVCRETLLSVGRGARVSWVDYKLFVPKELAQAGDFEPYSGVVVAVDLVTAGLYADCSGTVFFVPMELVVDVDVDGGALNHLSLQHILKNTGGKRLRVQTAKFDAGESLAGPGGPAAQLRRASTRSPARSASSDSAGKGRGKGKGAAVKPSSKDSTPTGTPKGGSPVAASGNRSEKLMATFGLQHLIEPGADMQKLREIKNLVQDQTLVIGDVKVLIMQQNQRFDTAMTEMEAKITEAVSKAVVSSPALTDLVAKAVTEVAGAGLSSAQHVREVAENSIKAIEEKSEEAFGHMQIIKREENVMNSSFDEDSAEPVFAVPAVPPLRSPAHSPAHSPATTSRALYPCIPRRRCRQLDGEVNCWMVRWRLGCIVKSEFFPGRLYGSVGGWLAS